jgi:hypothetical protein
MRLSASSLANACYTIRHIGGDTFPSIGKSIPAAYLFRRFAIAFVSGSLFDAGTIERNRRRNEQGREWFKAGKDAPNMAS